jgi:PAS domain S-box-containing protein
MASSELLGLLLNAGLLLAMVTVLDILSAAKNPDSSGIGRVIAGVAVGLIGIGLIAAPLRTEPGVQFDTRSVLLSVSGLLLGPVPTIVAMVMTGLYRYSIGGAWIVGCLVIAASGGIGLLWRPRHAVTSGRARALSLFVMGVVVHLVMLALIAQIPDGVGPRMVAAVGVPVMLVYPFATLLLGLLLTQRMTARETARRLRDQEREYRHLFNANPHPMWVYDRDTLQFLAVNARAVAVYGYSQAEFLAMTLDQLMPASERPHFRHMLASTSTRPADQAVLRQHVTKTGQILDVEIIAHTTEFQGRPSRLVLAHDVTASRHMLEERERLIAAIEQSEDSIVMTTADGTIEYVNPAFEEVTGYTRDEVLGQNPRILRSGEQSRETYAQLWQTILAGHTWRGRLVNRRKDGTHFHEDATISPVRDRDGKVSSFVAVKRDVSREIELEAQYLQSQKMESVGRLAAGVAHDFNNLLTIINGSAELAAQSVEPDDPIAEDLGQILAAGARGAALTRQLLAFSRQQVTKPAVLELDRVIDNVERMLIRLLPEHITLQVTPGLGSARVSADAAQIEQILLNLVVNARDAMPQGGVLQIQTGTVELNQADAARLRPAVAEGRFARISVIDSGVGFDETVGARIFEPFFTTKAVGKGTGLGLATVLQIVQESRGGVSATSQPGHGARFDVYLPLVDDEAPPPAEAHVAPAHRHHGTILVVEDEDVVRHLAVRALTHAGFTVITATHGRDGLDVAEAHPGVIDLVVTDIVMPEMGGPEMVTQLRKTRPAAAILYTSGYTGDRDLSDWIRDAEVPFLAKPYSPAELVDMATTLIAAGRHL